MGRDVRKKSPKNHIRRPALAVYRTVLFDYNDIMDAWLAPEAALHFKALGLTAGKKGMTGFLIGHRRGGRWIVERILPAASTPAGILPRFHEIEKIFDDRILGFFLLNPGDTDKKRLLVPSFTGRLVLEMRSGQRIQRPIRAFTVEFAGQFRLNPLPLAGLPPGE